MKFIIHATANGGYSTEQSIRNGWSTKRHLKDWWATMLGRSKDGLPDPISELEINIYKAHSFDKADEHLRNDKYTVFVDGYLGHVRPDPSQASEAAALEREKNGRTYLYYVFLGLVRSGGAYGVRFCKCCAWRLISPTGKKLCPSCRVKQNDSESRTAHRQQKSIYRILEANPVFHAFLEVRTRGERYLAERAIGTAPKPEIELPTGDNDTTPDAEYRLRKLVLSDLWHSCYASSRVRKRLTTDENLMALATKGFSRAEAAAELGLSRAAVTKACARNPPLKEMFDKCSRGKTGNDTYPTKETKVLRRIM
jgi:hypothetical protein